MRAALALLILAGSSLFAEDTAPLSFDFIPTDRSDKSTTYRLLVTNTSQESLFLGSERRHYGRGVTWDRTDTYASSMTLPGTTTVFPAFYAEVVEKNGKTAQLGGNHIKQAIQNPTGAEDSFCTLAPGESVSCQYPTFRNKPDAATFHFLQRSDGKVGKIQVALGRENLPQQTWERATGFSAPETDASRLRLYEVPFSVFGIHKPDLPVVQTRREVFDLKPWCKGKALAEGEIDFAFFDFWTGFCLISTSEANHLKLKELQFEPH
jgi:hypothetical protein